MATKDVSRLRSHLSGSLPISIAVHLFVLLLIVVVPLVANVVVPVVSVTMPDYVRIALPPPPPDVPTHRPSAAPPAPRPSSVAPTVAPPTIEPERPQPIGDPAPVLDVTNGVPGGTGLAPIGSIVTTVPPAPEPPRQTGPVRVADLPVPPRKTVDIRPIYPDFARTARIQGTVVMEAVLDPSGRVTQLRVIKSVPLLDQAAVDAVRQWRYTPSLFYGKPVSVLMTITVKFQLQ